MKHTSRVVIGLTLMALMLGGWSLSLAQKKVKAYTSQVGHTFVNAESGPVNGLQVVISAQGIVETESESGHAGPFRNVSGNETSTIVMSNPTEPVAVGDKVELVFKSYNKNLKIKSWWWTDEKGKRIGKKN